MVDNVWAEIPGSQLRNTLNENRNCLYAFLEVLGPHYTILKNAFRIVMGETENVIVIENERNLSRFLCIKRFHAEWEVHRIGRYPLEKLWTQLIGSNKIVLTKKLQEAAEFDDAALENIISIINEG